MPFDAASTVTSEPRSSGDVRRIRLIFLGDDRVRSFDLKLGQAVRIGRSEESDIVLPDERLSRQHVLVETEPLRITDLGSANGTVLGGMKLEADKSVSLPAGASVEIGSTTLIAQELNDEPPLRPLSTHSYLEARLDDEIRERSAVRTPFSLLFVKLIGSAEPELVETTLRSVLGPTDAIAAFAPGEYELMLLDAAASRGEAVADEIRDAFTEAGLDVDVGLSVFPNDGIMGQVLIAKARASLHGQVLPPSSEAIVEDPGMKALYKMVERVSRGTISVLLVGETGAGKEVLAEAIHASSPRSDGPLVRINCAAISETLVESELFGHKKGAFTGAVSDKKGLIESAQGGTAFLDEIGELPPGTQAKLLRVLEENEVRRIGSLEPIKVDVRFVAATNRDLEREVATGNFREDLYYRLNGVSLRIPALRERRTEIRPLAEALTARVAADLGVSTPAISDEAMTLLENYEWPGNIRELRNILERAVLLAEPGAIEPTHLPQEKLTAKWTPPSARPTRRPAPAGLSPEDEAARNRIMDALDACAGNQTRAAEQLGVSRQTLSNWLNRYGIPRPRKR